MSCEHQHHHGGHGDGHDEGDHVLPIATNESQSLWGKIDIPHVSGLNVANPPEDIGKVFRSSEEKYQLKPVVKSDCDEQIIINVPFANSSVKLFSVIIRTNGDKYCPKVIKLFKNDRGIDFDNVENKKALFTIKNPRVGVMYNDGEDEVPDVLEDDSDFVEHYLPRHKFAGTQHLTLFIEKIHSEDEDESHIHYIELRGEASELTKDPVITLYESAANPADHKNILEQTLHNSIGN